MTAAKTRRRGTELEDALLAAAWEQLVTEGFGRFTFDAIAERAGTSKPVLYRRWGSREELLRAALAHRGSGVTGAEPDTGSLRSDLHAILRAAAAGDNTVAALISALVSSHFGDIEMTPAELRAALIGSRQTAVAGAFDRAVARGEVAADVLTPRVIDLPFTLFRAEYLMTFSPPSDAVIEEFLDQIVLPLVMRRG